MTPLTIAMLAIFLTIFIGFIVITVILFYHIGRYSFLGDASKRIFTFYFSFGALISLAALVLLITNHLIS